MDHQMTSMISFHLISTRFPKTRTNTKEIPRTHDAFLPSPNAGPSLQEVFHNQHIGDHTLVVPKSQTTNGGEQGTSERISVSQQSGDPGWTVTIGVRIRSRGGKSRARSRIKCRGGKVQTSTIRNRSDTVAFLGIVTRGSVCDVALPWIFSAERRVVLRAGIVAHDCKARGIGEERSRKSKFFSTSNKMVSR